MKKRIIWSRWVNPLSIDHEYIEEGVGEHIVVEDGQPSIIRPVVPTAAGLIPVNVYGHFSANFDFWVLHTNFNLSLKVLDIIRRIPGVETLDVVSRYRARIGIGKCFSFEKVRDAIEVSLGVASPLGEAQREKMGAITLDDETKKIVSILRREAESHAKFWAIYVIPNGGIAFGQSENGADYENMLDLYTQSQRLAGGIVFSSHDD